MNLITRVELGDLTDAELATLLALISRELSQAKPGSLEYQGALISLENIRREQAKRRERERRPEPTHPPAKPRGPRGPGF